MAYKQIDPGYAPSESDIVESGIQAGEANWNIPRPNVDRYFVKAYMPLFREISDATLNAFRRGFWQGRRQSGGRV